MNVIPFSMPRFTGAPIQTSSPAIPTAYPKTSPSSESGPSMRACSTQKPEFGFSSKT